MTESSKASRRLIASLLISVLVISAIGVPTVQLAAAFETQCTGAVQLFNIVSAVLCNAAVWAGHPYHQEITSEALYFLKDDVVEKINRGHEYADFISAHQFDSTYHFDSCTFDDATKAINDHYAVILSSLRSNGNQGTLANYFFEESSAEAQFGIVLHAAQDFYSHTNWVELQAAGWLPGGLL